MSIYKATDLNTPINQLTLPKGQSIMLKAAYSGSGYTSFETAIWTATQGVFTSSVAATAEYTAGNANGQITAEINGVNKTINVTVTAAAGIAVNWNVANGFVVKSGTAKDIIVTVTKDGSPYTGDIVLSLYNWGYYYTTVWGGGLSFGAQTNVGSVTIHSGDTVVYNALNYPSTGFNDMLIATIEGVQYNRSFTVNN